MLKLERPLRKKVFSSQPKAHGWFWLWRKKASSTMCHSETSDAFWYLSWLHMELSFTPAGWNAAVLPVLCPGWKTHWWPICCAPSDSPSWWFCAFVCVYVIPPKDAAAGSFFDCFCEKMQATFWRDGNWKEKRKEVSVNRAVFLEHGAFLILVCCASSRCCHSAGLGKQWVQVLLFPDTFRSGCSSNQYVPCSGAVYSSKALGLCQVCLRARPLEGYQALIALCACQCFFVSDRPVLCPSSLYGWHTINPWLLTDGLKIFKKTERLLALIFY